MYEWSLTELYPSFDSREFQADFTALDQLLADMSELKLEDSIDGIKKAIVYLEQFELITERLGSYISLTLATDTTNQVASNYDVLFQQKLATFAKQSARYQRFLGTITTNIQQDATLADYQFFFAEMKQNAQYLLSDEVEDVIGKLSLSGGNAWEQLFSNLTSSLEGTYNGKPITLSEVRNLAYDSDATVRKAAYEAELAMYESIKEPIAFALNSIKGHVTTQVNLRGYESALDQTLQASRMSRATLDALLGAMKEFLPAFQRYLKHKARLLGHKNGLPFYDLFAPIGKSERTFTVEESREFLVQNFRSFAQDLATLTEESYDKQYIDFLPRKGKVGGAFCHHITQLKQSRVLTNFSGSLSDVVTLAHELGHSYHGLHIEEHRVLNREYSMPVAETASTFNENIVMNTAIAQADTQEKIALIESQLQDTTQIIVDIYSRYLFESTVFEKHQTEFLFANDLKELMVVAQKEAYGDGLDPNYLHPFMWVCKPHYYSTYLSFYNFPYAFGGLFSKGLYALYQQQPDGFLEKYQALLRATTVSSVEDTARTMGIDITQKEFWVTALQQIEASIEQFIELTS